MSSKPPPSPRPATAKEILAEVTALERLRSLIPPRNVFGDDNLAKIDAEITVLNEGMDEDDIADRYEPLCEDQFEDADDPEQAAREANEVDGRSEEVAFCARLAAEWRDDITRPKPSNDWAPIARKDTA